MPFTLFLKFLKCIGFLCAALNAWRSLGISCDFSQLPSSQFHIYTQGYVYVCVAVCIKCAVTVLH